MAGATVKPGITGFTVGLSPLGFDFAGLSAITEFDEIGIVAPCAD
jgi:hypothetical protein